MLTCIFLLCIRFVLYICQLLLKIHLYSFCLNLNKKSEALHSFGCQHMSRAFEFLFFSHSSSLSIAQVYLTQSNSCKSKIFMWNLHNAGMWLLSLDL